MALGPTLKHLRHRRGLTQVALARHLRCTQAAVAHYEAGTREPSLATLRTLAKVLKVSLAELVK